MARYRHVTIGSFKSGEDNYIIRIPAFETVRDINDIDANDTLAYSFEYDPQIDEVVLNAYSKNALIAARNFMLWYKPPIISVYTYKYFKEIGGSIYLAQKNGDETNTKPCDKTFKEIFPQLDHTSEVTIKVHNKSFMIKTENEEHVGGY